ncbi:hypothetical protein RM574_18325 [Streptomyces sp. DSM 41982]|uniref:Secreted protein n=1 Tax=Streptomyces evansiae TaxID=3075535 RepID=A0ABD5E8U0_9ACTN|nr:MULTISPECIES: hypothetical protein [unclassified Streptomyces]MDT0417446.1 hypothetical protein [Streptomyces sp. DSM 41982]SCD37142.1 hypothetical protein GA0115246_100915 [Streptomyces sp. SolWspMP-sol7th]
MTAPTARRGLRLLVALSALALGSTATPGAAAPEAVRAHDAAPARSGGAHRDCPSGEVFATNNTAVVTDPADPRLRTRLTRFDREVRGIIRAHGARPGASTLLDGVFWSAGLGKTTFERSREFDVDGTGRDGLRHLAGVLAKRYHQESVLTFRCLPRHAPATDAARIEAPGVSAAALREALRTHPGAREELGGGSVTEDGRLVLVSPLEELPLARKFTKDLGVDWNTAEVRYGEREFVS